MIAAGAVAVVSVSAVPAVLAVVLIVWDVAAVGVAVDVCSDAGGERQENHGGPGPRHQYNCCCCRRFAASAVVLGADGAGGAVGAVGAVSGGVVALCVDSLVAAAAVSDFAVAADADEKCAASAGTVDENAVAAGSDVLVLLQDSADRFLTVHGVLCGVVAVGVFAALVCRVAVSVSCVGAGAVVFSVADDAVRCLPLLVVQVFDRC